MPLILVGSEKNVAIVVYDGVEPLDFAGPLEVFAADLGHFNVFTLSRDGTPITTGVGGLTVVPKYSFDSAPRASILVVPGGGTGALTRDERSMAFIRRAAAEAEIVMSVCSGAFVLGSAGLLDGLKATAHDADVEELEAAFPKVAAIRGARYVDNGKIITAGGVSAGIDAALHVIARLHGDDRAERVSAYLQHSRRAE
jgi:transcriptional regulator GlxA family with amidase domain